MAVLLAGELTSDPAFNPIRVTSDGEQALALLESGFVPGLVLLDLELPKVNGRQVLNRLREDPRFADTAIVVTGSEGVPDARGRGRLGEIWYPKPFKVDGLRSAIRAAIGPRHAEPCLF